jgi:hypothetical protein
MLLEEVPHEAGGIDVVVVFPTKRAGIAFPPGQVCSLGKICRFFQC